MKVNKNTQEVLASLPREQLRQMLQEELGKDTAGIDEKFVRLLMAELQRRGSDPKLADDAAVEAVCEKFRQDTKKAAKPKKYRYPSNWLS